MERNVIAATTTTILAPFVDGWQKMLIWLIVAVVLVLGDLRFGIEAAKKRGETVRRSRAVRRTVNKLVDYLCWICIAWTLGTAFGGPLGVPLLAIIIMALVCLIELSSILDNYFECKGIKKRLNVFKLIGHLFKKPELEDCFEDKEDGTATG